MSPKKAAELLMAMLWGLKDLHGVVHSFWRKLYWRGTCRYNNFII